ncbi:protein bric-a-brac 1-like isoform X5 [Macrosteles quadrilineatus]|uniref:protein bric-a-brac 1-like isoform X5 n=1 Tax=Macrosteles quadrilineatus TaxID=74068 RepID=UPI0023E2C99D|nr:protein bric-a-brac 1-like isoform X5 [Macrosteles quadrilineatus]
MHHYGPGGGAGSPQQFCLRWNNYQSNLTNVFDQLLQSESFVDVTLACDGHSVKAHKMVLSACSPYFQALFFDNPCQHPIVILKDIKWPELKAVVEFMYKGEINVSQEQIGPLLKVAESLKVRGLADVNSEHDLETKTGDESVSMSPNRPSKKRRRASAEPSSPAEDASEALELVTTSPSTPSSLPPPATPGPATPGGPNPMMALSLPPPPPPPPPQSAASAADDCEIKPGIAEMIREEERAKMLESSHAWLGASTSSLADSSPSLLKMKAPTWTQPQLKEAIQAIVTQKMRFTEASTHYGIPKGTLYDNILGKTNRMMVLEEAGLTYYEETAVLDFCCDLSVSPYNRRTKKPLKEILGFVEKLRRDRDPDFAFTGLAGFRWWWAFCKKHSVVSMNYGSNNNNNNEKSISPPPVLEQKQPLLT